MNQLLNQPSRLTICSAMAAIAVFMVAALLQLPLKAQNSYGSIVGTVTDTSGAVVPDASLIVTNIGTGVVVKTQADAGGKYSVQDLLPANYKVQVEKSNFKRTERASVTVEVGAVVRIDFALAVGNVSETVEVSTATPLLQTDTSSVNQEVEGDVVQQMPLNGRNVMNLIALAPGVIPAGGAAGSSGLNQQTGRTGYIVWNNWIIGGGIQGWSADYIDGAPNQFLGNNIVALIPTQDALQEFNVVSSDATADYGRFSGGVVNMTTKSGSNAFHGSAYEYFRNADFNANIFFNNRNGLPRIEWNQNQYGASASGPIKKDKAFFMFTWENFKINSQQVNSTFVPTAAMQSGTFTKPIHDPLGNCNIVNNGNGTYSITNLYKAGLVSGACGDPVNEVMKQYFPLPNINGVGYNWIANTPFTNSQTQYNGRVDYQITPKQRFFARYSDWKSIDGFDSEFNDIGSPAPGSTTPTTWPTALNSPFYFTHQGVLGDTYTLTPTTVLDVHAIYSRRVYIQQIQNSAVNESQFDQYSSNKYYTALAPQMNIHSLPVDVITGADSLYSFQSTSNGATVWENTYALSASLVKILGPHTLKVGFEARLMDYSGSANIGKSAGYYSYDSTFAGDEFAGFLMGYPGGATAAQFQNFQNTAAYSYYQGYYVMDDWQVSRKLTLNVGLRYELPGATAERNNKLSVLLPHTLDPYTGITGTEGLVHSSLYAPRTDVVEEYNLFAPRVGFAYRATSNTVLKAGYGLSYLPEDLAGVSGIGTLPQESPFNSILTTVNISESGSPTPLQTILGCVVNGPTASGCNTLVTQAGILQANPTPPANFMTSYGSTSKYLGQTLVAPDPYQAYPYVQEWNAGLSHQFKGNWMTSVSYSGLKGTNLPENASNFGYFSIDELQSQYYSMGATALSTTSSATDGIGGCPNAPSLLGKITVAQCLRPNPYYAGMQDSAAYYGRQNYKSLQVTSEKRFGSGGVINANYSWSRNMADTDTGDAALEESTAPHVDQNQGQIQDYNNLGAEYSLLMDDVPNRLVVDYELNLPFGKGQKYANDLSGPLNTIASGWAVNGITIFQSGFPLAIQSSTKNLLWSTWGSGPLRPSVVPGCNKKIGGGSLARVNAGQWFNTACFQKAVTSSDPTGGVTFGNEPRVDPDIRMDGIKNFDFAFQKSTPLGFESSSFVFRAEFFNIMNRVQFNPPAPLYGATNFGTVSTQANNPRQIQLSARVNF